MDWSDLQLQIMKNLVMNLDLTDYSKALFGNKADKELKIAVSILDLKNKIIIISPIFNRDLSVVVNTTQPHCPIVPI